MLTAAYAQNIACVLDILFGLVEPLSSELGVPVKHDGKHQERQDGDYGDNKKDVDPLEAHKQCDFNTRRFIALIVVVDCYLWQASIEVRDKLFSDLIKLSFCVCS
jgi:hypothetical protein